MQQMTQNGRFPLRIKGLRLVGLADLRDAERN